MSPSAGQRTQPSQHVSVKDLGWAHIPSHMVLYLEPQRHTGAGDRRCGLGYSHPLTCVVLTVAFIELHQHGRWDNQEVPQRRHH